MISDTIKLIALCAIVIAAGCTVHARVGVQHGTSGGDQHDLTPQPDPSPQPPPSESDAPPATPPGQTCSSSMECPRGQTCQGEQGCDSVWTCQPERICTRDLVPFCGCDGETYRASSTCPDRPYLRRGPCEPQANDQVAPPPPPSVSEPNQPDTGSPIPCTSSAGCPDGQMCMGAEGCDAQWTCQPRRPCTMDLVPFCDCGGETFRASSTCPGRPYAHRGACP